MYAWLEKEYLGAAHGVSGIYQILLSYSNLLSKDEREDLKRSVDWLLTIQDNEGNFPSSMKKAGKLNCSNELVHWCHGAPGIIHLLITAHLTYANDPKYLQAAIKAAQLIWQKGVLKKGPGICHGVSGNGYTFLLLYRLTSNSEYLNKAKAFAAIIMDPTFEERARIPDCPYSLFEGWAGALCFLCDIKKPFHALFPMVAIPFSNTGDKKGCNCC